MSYLQHYIICPVTFYDNRVQKLHTKIWLNIAFKSYEIAKMSYKYLQMGDIIQLLLLAYTIP